MQLRQQPAVQRASFRGLRRALNWRPAVYIGVGDEEAVGIPQRGPELLDHFVYEIDREAPRFARRARGVHIPAEGIGAGLLKHHPGVDGVAQALGHFLTVFIKNVAQADDILEGDGFKEHRRDGMQAVKPATRLIHRLADIVGRVLLFQDVAVSLRIRPLRHLHRAAIEPDVDHFGHTAHRAALAIRVGKGDFIDIGTMQIELA